MPEIVRLAKIRVSYITLISLVKSHRLFATNKTNVLTITAPHLDVLPIKNVHMIGKFAIVAAVSIDVH